MTNAEQEVEILKLEEEKDERDKVNTETLRCALTYIKII